MQYFPWYLRAYSVQINNHARQVLRILEYLFDVAVRIAHPRVIRNSRGKLAVLTKTITEGVYCHSEFHERVQFNRSGNTEVDVILVRTEIPLKHKLRDCDFSIYRTTEIFVALPLIGRNIVRRCGSQRDQGWLKAVGYES